VGSQFWLSTNSGEFQNVQQFVELICDKLFKHLPVQMGALFFGIEFMPSTKAGTVEQNERREGLGNTMEKY
jgi:hypothetical protein